jgi:hypothetical protein
VADNGHIARARRSVGIGPPDARWKLLHPIIAAAMKKADGDQLARLAAVVEGRAN